MTHVSLHSRFCWMLFSYRYIQLVCMYVYIGFKTFFYAVRHLDSIASYLPTGLHLDFFRSWPSLSLPSSFSSVFLVLSFVSASTSILFWAVFLLPFFEHEREESVVHQQNLFRKMLYSNNETTCFGLYWPSSGFFKRLRRVYISVWGRIDEEISMHQTPVCSNI